jgi:DNA-binding response OmpR family regulator
MVTEVAHHRTGISVKHMESQSATQESILVVEDEPLVAESLEDWLQGLGYSVTVAPTGQQALASAKELQPDLVLMDIRLGGGLDGISTARLIRESMRAPVVFLTGLTDVATIERAASVGPSGYLIKPFTVEQLAASVHLALHKTPEPAPPPSLIRIQDLEIDVARYRVFRAGQEVRLTKKEFQILACLAEAPGSTLSPETILAKAWGHQYVHYIQTVRVHVANLRQKIEPLPNAPRYIETVPGLGYRLIDKVAAPSQPQS